MPTRPALASGWGSAGEAAKDGRGTVIGPGTPSTRRGVWIRVWLYHLRVEPFSALLGFLHATGAVRSAKRLLRGLTRWTLRCGGPPARLRELRGLRSLRQHGLLPEAWLTSHAHSARGICTMCQALGIKHPRCYDYISQNKLSLPEGACGQWERENTNE